jgi:hypothetical protein
MLQRWAWDQFCLNNKVIHKCINVRITLRNCLLQTNYDVGNQELLAVKLALEEWRHWLEGAKDTFVILTDHCNLAYIQTARRLNPRQARWALIFTTFDFTLTYHPGSKNSNALSCQQFGRRSCPALPLESWTLWSGTFHHYQDTGPRSLAT